MISTFEDALQAPAKTVHDIHSFDLGQPLWVHGDDGNCWIPIAFFRAGWSEWYAACVPEDNLTGEPYNFPCSWLTGIMPGEPEWAADGISHTAQIINLDDYRRQ